MIVGRRAAGFDWYLPPLTSLLSITARFSRHHEVLTVGTPNPKPDCSNENGKPLVQMFFHSPRSRTSL